MAAPNDSDTLKRDPDYYVPSESCATNKNVLEENARSNTAKKISAIVEAEFLKEIDSKKAEIFNIFKALTKATKMMHYLRFAIVTDYYNKGQLNEDGPESLKQTRPHPTVNAPKRKVPFVDMADQYTCLAELGIKQESKNSKFTDDFIVPSDISSQIDAEQVKESSNETNKLENKGQDKQISKEIIDVPSSISSNYKTRKRIIVGNISKWISPEFREKSDITHKWTIYVRDVEKSDLSSIISKVRFFLHSSYRPNDVIELTTSPFHLSRLGWGEFPVRVQLHFANGINKPVDIIHQLKLDQTYTGLQTLGMETVVDIYLSTKKLLAVPDAIENFDDDMNCDDNSKAESKLTLLLKDRLNHSKDENITILHDVPMDHDYVNINSKSDNESSNQSMPQEEEEEEKEDVLDENSLDTENENSSSTLKQLNNKSTAITGINFEPHDYSQHSSNSSTATKDKPHSKRLIKEESLEALVAALNSSKITDTTSLLRTVALLTPMITERASEPSYKTLHPYASESYSAFLEHRTPKQYAMERQRAVRALEIISRSNHHRTNLTAWDFISWARRYGYTPLLKSSRRKRSSIKEEDRPDSTTTLEDQVQEWLANLESSNAVDEDDVEVDILALPSTPARPARRPSPPRPKEPADLLDQPSARLQEYARGVAESRGHELTIEELEPGIAHASASLLVGLATERLVEELLRLSLGSAFDRSAGSELDNLVIEPDDVRTALLKRNEFQILSNHGLGSDE